MILNLDCIPCLLNQALKTASLAWAELPDVKKKSLLNEIMLILQDDSIMDMLPAKTGRRVYRKVGEYLGNDDIYKEIKTRSNAMAMALFPRLEEKVLESSNALKTAATIAILGNLIDFGANLQYDLDYELERLHLAIDHFDALEASLRGASSLLYIGDNAGEIIFDKVFLQEIKRRYPVKIFFSVRSGPIINDALLDDALFAGIDEFSELVEGTASPGIILDEASERFREIYFSADLIISKGQGNFESLSERPRSENIFFLLKAKCKLMEDYFHVPLGSSILAHWQSL
ncbi:MAG: damage-control phosphatase ARMT1 family protein [Promethearchaeota archaeon]